MTNYFGKSIVDLARQNTDFRREVVTGKQSQVVVMNIKPGEDIGVETHADTDQTLVFVGGQGKAELNGQSFEVGEGSLVLVPAGTEHNFTNTGQADLTLYTIYAPAHHPAGTVHHTKEDAQKATY